MDATCPTTFWVNDSEMGRANHPHLGWMNGDGQNMKKHETNNQKKMAKAGSHPSRTGRPPSCRQFRMHLGDVYPPFVHLPDACLT